VDFAKAKRFTESLFGGFPERFLRLAARTLRLDISDAILNELLRVLREKFQWDA
jgi:hypothetical protein